MAIPGQDSFVVVPTIGTGVNIDNQQITQAGGAAVNRQRVSHPDALTVVGDVLSNILIEMRLTNLLLAQAFGITENLDILRDDVTNIYAVDDVN